ncbi:MAG: DUF2723 domain-containing protein [Nitrospirota bacterium]
MDKKVRTQTQKKGKRLASLGLKKKGKSIKGKQTTFFLRTLNQQEIEVSPISEKGFLVGIGVFLISFFVYLKTVAPTVTFSDSGEFITCASTLGITHPTGYPTWTMLAHLITYLPIGNIAMRVNLLSGIFGALTIMTVYFILIKLRCQIKESCLVVAVSSSLIFAFSSTLWKVCVIAEVYTLYALFSAATIFSLLAWKEQKEACLVKDNLLYLSAFVYGLGLTNHLLIVFLCPAILYFLWITDRKLLLLNRPKVLGKMFLFLFMGLIPYIYLPIRGFQSPLIDWGNPVTLENFFRLITGKIYKETMFSIPLPQLLETIKHHLWLLTQQFTPYFGILSLFGIFILYKRSLKLLIFFGLIFFVNTCYSLGFQKVIFGLLDHECYHLPSYIVLTILMGFGMAGIIEYLKFKQVKSYISWVVLLFPVIVCANHHYQSDMSRYYFARDYGKNILNQLPENSILFNQVDYNVFPLWYLQYVEKQKIDVPVFTVLFLTRDWFVERLLKLYPEIKVTCSLKEKHTHIFDNIIYNNRDTHPIYFTHDFLTQKEEVSPPPLIKEGIINKLKEQPLLGDKFKYNYRGVFDRLVCRDVWADEVMLVYSYYHAELGQRYQLANRMEEALEELNMAVKIDPRNASYQAALAGAYNAKGDYNKAIEVLGEAIKKNQKSPDLYYNLGLTYYYQRNYQEALVQLEKGMKLAPQDTNLLNVLGLCYHLNGRQQEAISTLQKALAIDPDSMEIRRNLELVLTATQK